MSAYDSAEELFKWCRVPPEELTRHPQAKVMVPFAGREPANTVIWEGRFASLRAAEEALKTLETSDDHSRLLINQIVFFKDAWVEFYEVLGL